MEESEEKLSKSIDNLTIKIGDLIVNMKDQKSISVNVLGELAKINLALTAISNNLSHILEKLK